jgi:CheY-like chemotaxis protein
MERCIQPSETAMTHVLVVDDNELVRYILERYLKSAGHRVTSAANGADAMALCRTMQFDVLVTDQNMPRMKGDALIARARSLQPDLRCILLSADPIPPSTLAADVTCMAKPLSRKDLIRLVAPAGEEDAPPH